jgi:hypothetical protein
MATTNSIVLFYAVLLALLALSLGVIVIWSRRELRMRLVALVLSVTTLAVGWMAFGDLTGRPKLLSVDDFKKEYFCAAVLHSDIYQNVGMELLMRKEDAKDAKLIFVPWNMKLARSLQRGQRYAKLNDNGTIIYGGKACFDEDGDSGNKKGKKGKRKKGTQPLRQPGGSSGEVDDGNENFNFYPNPVPPLPEKNYGPLYEAPLQIPDRK